jgi:hypothetical protein
MISESQVNNIINQFNEDGRTKTFAEFIATLYKDKVIEIYLGDSFEEVSMDQISVSYPAVFCGKVMGAYRECLIICGSVNSGPGSDKKLANMVLINERAIRGLTEMDGNGTMDEMFMKSGGAEADRFREQFSK